METDPPNQKLVQQIARLQDRQRELIQQAADELEILKHDIEGQMEERVRQQTGVLLQELEQLRQTVSRLEQERALQAATLMRIQHQAVAYANQLRDIVAPAPASFPQAAPIPSTPAVVTAAPIPIVPSVPPPVTVPVITEPATTSLTQEPPRPKAKNPKKKPRLKRLLTRSFSLALFVGIGYFGWHLLLPPPTTAQGINPAGKVAGVSTDPSITGGTAAKSVTPQDDPTLGGEYPESYADAAYEDTQWETDKDPADMGLSIMYPANTSNRIHLPGGSNLWFLRKNGYLMKITKFDTTDLLDDWWVKNKGDYEVDYQLVKGSFKGMPAWIAQPKQPDPTTDGTYYFIKPYNSVYQIWIKFESDPASADAKRINKMVDSLQFLN